MPDRELLSRLDERSVGRLNALADAVFAISMTLLALDLRLPDLGSPSDRQLRDALGHLWPQYVSFLISFYVIASYWRRQHREMRAVERLTPKLVQHTFTLLLTITAVPFVASVLASYGAHDGIALVVYAGLNVLALVEFLLLRRAAIRGRVYAAGVVAPPPWDIAVDLVGFAVAAPAGYVIPHYGITSLVVILLVTGGLGRRLTKRAMRGDEAQEAFGEPDG